MTEENNKLQYETAEVEILEIVPGRICNYSNVVDDDTTGSGGDTLVP